MPLTPSCHQSQTHMRLMLACALIFKLELWKTSRKVSTLASFNLLPLTWWWGQSEGCFVHSFRIIIKRSEWASCLLHNFLHDSPKAPSIVYIQAFWRDQQTPTHSIKSQQDLSGSISSLKLFREKPRQTFSNFALWKWIGKAEMFQKADNIKE